MRLSLLSTSCPHSDRRPGPCSRRSESALTAGRRRSAAALGLFALSPLPSGQLFVAAGLMTVRLVPLTAAFFAGRLVSYSIYVSAASIAERNLGSLALDSLTSPVGIGLQLAMLFAVAALVGRAGNRIPEGGDSYSPPETNRATRST